MNEILYFEIQGRKVAIQTKRGNLICNETMSAVMEQLDPERFVRCHQSYIINFNYVFEIRRYEVVLMNKEVIPASRTYWDDLKRCFLKAISG